MSEAAPNYLSSRELWWLSLGTMLRALRQEKRPDIIHVTPQGPFGLYFMKKAGLAQFFTGEKP